MSSIVAANAFVYRFEGGKWTRVNVDANANADTNANTDANADTYTDTNANADTNAHTDTNTHMIIYLHGEVVFMEYQIHVLLRDFNRIFGSDEDQQVLEYMLILMASYLDG